MRKIITLLTLAATVTCGVSAQQLKQTRELPTTAEPVVSQVVTMNHSFCKQDSRKNKVGFLGVRKVIQRANSDKGTVIDVMKEDFSKFTTGNYGNPDYNTDTHKDVYEYPWINQNDSFYNTPGWGGENMYAAGGAVYLEADADTYQAHINTPMLNVSNYQQIVVISFKARTDRGEVVNNALIEAAETYNMSPTWDLLGGILLPEVTEEWGTYEAVFYGGGQYTLFNIVASCAGPQDNPIPQSFYVDDVHVYQIDTYVDMPKLLPYTNYKGSSFDVNWEPVEGADHYLLDLYDYSVSQDEPNYALLDEMVTGTSYTFEGAQSGLDYYYTLRAVDKNGHESFVTLPLEVSDLEAPVFEPTTEIVDGQYTASWNDVPYAECYNYKAYVKRVAEKDGEFVVTDEDFTGVCDVEGNLTGWTKENPQTSCYDEYYLPELTQGGWIGTQYAPYTDYICLDGWQYVYNKKDASLQSPDLDLSKDGGKVKLSVKLCGAEFDLTGYEDQDGNPLSGMKVVDAAAVMFKYDQVSGDYVQTEIYYNRELEKDWKACEFNFTTGSPRSIVGIFCVQPENLYVDDLKITQQYKAGEEFMDPFVYYRFANGTSQDVVLPGRTLNCEVYHEVAGVKSPSDFSGSKKPVEGQRSELTYVGNATTVGIQASTVMQDKLVVRLEGNQIVVDNALHQNVGLYSVDGRLLDADCSGAAQVALPVSESGIYLVKVGNQTVKIGF